MGLLSPGGASAQDGRRCFDVPGITNCIEGRFREYWEQNGGLPVFGYPITAATTEKTAEGSFLTQYFERNRFELHPEKARPYDVLLGRLGDDRLKQQKRDWRAFGAAKKIEGCLFFAETNHNICDLSGGAGFKSYWESHGLQDPALDRFQRSLALFGLPLSEVTVETNAAGDTVMTQWFERGRFEYHLDQPREFQVLLGLLGNETRNPPATTTQPLPTPQPVKPRLCDGIPGPEGAIAVPDCVKAGEKVLASLFGYAANEAISYRVTTAAGAAIGGAQTARANQVGNAQIEIDTGRYGGSALRPGDYILVAQGGSGRTTKVGFRVLP
jgi:hypothetical protein